jgi:hypothetical protein
MAEFEPAYRRSYKRGRCWTALEIFENTEPCPTTGCWIWRMGVGGNGYGYAYTNGKMVLAHRLSFLLHKGEIPDGLVIDHICGLPCCVNPDHLRAVTQRVNSISGNAPNMVTYRMGRCLKCGSELTRSGPNTHLRRCGPCNLKRSREYDRTRRNRGSKSGKL